ncbi:hypothetical protein [Streptomyces tubercidicus]
MKRESTDPGMQRESTGPGMQRESTDLGLRAVRGFRRVQVLPGRTRGGGAAIAVTVSVGEHGTPAASRPACARFCGVWDGSCGEVAADTDEHFAVDAENCTDERWLACADVLHGSRPWAAGSAMGRVRDLLARYTGCRLAGLPLTGGGWAVAERLGTCRLIRSAFLRPVAPQPRERDAWEYSLMASCLHGLVATGHTLEELLPLTVLSLA